MTKPNPEARNISTQLNAWLKYLGRDLRVVALEMNLSGGLQAFARGTRLATPEMVQRIVEKLDITVEQFFADPPPKEALAEQQSETFPERIPVFAEAAENAAGEHLEVETESAEDDDEDEDGNELPGLTIGEALLDALRHPIWMDDDDDEGEPDEPVAQAMVAEGAPVQNEEPSAEPAFVQEGESSMANTTRESTIHAIDVGAASGTADEMHDVFAGNFAEMLAQFDEHRDGWNYGSQIWEILKDLKEPQHSAARQNILDNARAVAAMLRQLGQPK